MRLGRIQKKIVEYLASEGGKAAIVFNQTCCPHFRFADHDDYMPSIERLVKRGVIKRLTPHFMYELNK